ncbi:LIM and senescent cell antigen-like-containing domain protein 2 isoform X1 [Sphaeramia orbicularis]|uniref:LIM domain-containing protein n=1 Tax=Sphaeramia orbicularis TaxID=375764 RepID=A0A673AV09_9TELE|nr:LIM and senescent cell antigen-like-containing domain protein 1 isoform X1 [Sphaeramia orbicularis]
MEMNGRALPPLIPEDGEAPDPPPHGEMNGYHHRLQTVDGSEDEVPVSKSQRRKSDVKVYKEFCDFYARFNMANALANAMCERCKSGFAPAEKIVNSNGELYHEQCFVCAQCFQQFPEGLFYEFEGRKYCEHDFQMLFAPCCHQCGEFIIGRVIKAMNNSWHPDCFCCDICQAVLADVGFVKNAGRHLCRPCHNREKARGLGKYICQKCHAIIEEQPLLFKNDPYHPDHFNCNNCGKELTADARELKGELYCLPCHDKMGVPICGACRRPIEGRVVNAMGKQWHVEHFVCAKCEKPFLGHRHYERKGLAYCETHYNQLFGDVCYHCNRVIEGDVVSALNKAWCVNCFACSTCNTKLTLKDKFVEVDLKPVCKHCYERLPDDMKRRLARRERDSKEKKKKLIPMCL